MIAVLNEGQVVESGKHDKLVAKHGVYHSLVEKQQVRGSVKEEKPTKLDVSIRESMTSSEFGLENQGKEQDII
jgi:hypothetical protein